MLDLWNLTERVHLVTIGLSGWVGGSAARRAVQRKAVASRRMWTGGRLARTFRTSVAMVLKPPVTTLAATRCGLDSFLANPMLPFFLSLPPFWGLRWSCIASGRIDVACQSSGG